MGDYFPWNKCKNCLRVVDVGLQFVILWWVTMVSFMSHRTWFLSIVTRYVLWSCIFTTFKAEKMKLLSEVSHLRYKRQMFQVVVIPVNGDIAFGCAAISICCLHFISWTPQKKLWQWERLVTWGIPVVASYSHQDAICSQQIFCLWPYFFMFSLTNAAVVPSWCISCYCLVYMCSVLLCTHSLLWLLGQCRLLQQHLCSLQISLKRNILPIAGVMTVLL